MPPTTILSPTTIPTSTTSTGRSPLLYGPSGANNGNFGEYKNKADFDAEMAYNKAKYDSFTLKIKQEKTQTMSGVLQQIDIAENELKIGLTALGLALQESANVTSAFFRGLNNKPKIAPNQNFLKRTEPDNDLDSDYNTNNKTNNFNNQNNPIVKSTVLTQNYNRRITIQPATVPVPQDPATATLQKPVVNVNQTIKNKTYGGTLHTPIVGNKLEIQQLDLTSALAQVSASSSSASDEFTKWLGKSHGANIQGKINFKNTAFTYFPESLGVNSFLVGTDAVEIMAKIFTEGANQAVINPPTIGVYSEINIQSRSVDVPNVTPVTIPLEHSNAGTAEQIKNTILFPEPVDVSVEDLMTALGANTTKTTLDSLDITNTPDRSEFTVAGNVLNGDSIVAETPQKIKTNNVFDLNFLATSALYYRQGLHEYPMQATKISDVAEKKETPEKTIIPNAATMQAYNQEAIDKKLGDFPLELEFKDENGNIINLLDPTDSPVPNIGDVPASKVGDNGNLLVNSLAGALGLGAILGAGNFIANSINFNNITNVLSMAAGAAAAATKAAGCACASADFLGNKSSPTCTEAGLPFSPGITGKNPKVAPTPPQGGIKQMLSPSTGCFPSQINNEQETILDLLRDIKYATGVVKAAVLKTPKDIEREKDAIEKMAKDLKNRNKQRWDDFKTAIKKDDSYLNKNFPLKPKIIERNADGTPKPEKP